MTISNSALLANAKLDQEETYIGTAPTLTIYSGSIPASADTALGAQVVLATGTLPSDWLGAAAAKVKSKAGTWTLTGQSGAGAGTAGTFWRILASAVCAKQGTFGAAITLTTNALTAANSNILNFAATTGAAVGQLVSGTGIVPGSVVLAVGGATVTLDRATTAGVANSTVITFGYDMTVDNNSIANAQVLTVNSFSITAGN